MKELEKEYDLQLFYRSKLGVTLTDDGRSFLNYARNVLDQVNLLDERFRKDSHRKHVFSVSAQHYAFVVHAFVELVKQLGKMNFNSPCGRPRHKMYWMISRRLRANWGSFI